MKHLKRFEDTEENKFKVGDLVTMIEVRTLEEVKKYVESVACEVVAIYDHKQYKIKSYCETIPPGLEKNFANLMSDDGEFWMVNQSERNLRYSTKEERELYLAIKNSKKYNL